MPAPHRPPITAVIFDMDGLLVDSEPFWRRVQRDVFAEIGADISPFVGHGHTMGLRVDEAIAYLAGATGVGESEVDAISATVVAGMVDAITNEAELLPGVREAIGACRGSGLVCALASGSTPPVIDAVLDRFSLRVLFDGGIFSAIDDMYGKPHPSIFLRVAEALGRDPAECAVFEDSLNGCIAAKAARMMTIAIPHPDDAGDPRFSIADAVCESLLDVLADPVAALLGLDPEAISLR